MKDQKYQPYKNEFQLVRKYLRWLAFHWGKSRYPILEGGVVVSPLDRYDNKFAEEAFDNAKFIYDILLKALSEVHNITI